VERILTIGRKGHAERRAIQWEPVIRDALKLIRFALPTNIKIDVQVDPRVPAVWAHPIELQQIFMNLVINSIHASTETGGTIYAQVAMPDIDDDYLAAHAESRSNKQVCLNVIDQGSGMSSDVLEHVFEPFFTTRKATEGTGLGLSIVHQIVKRLGGTIVVKSSLGKGTHVSVCLPASDINAASLRQNDESANNPQLK
jgi:signal transduction histidine kinase